MDPNCSASLGLRPASSCGLASVPAEEGNSIDYIPNLSFFPGLEWKLVREWRDSDPRVYGCWRPARLGREVWRRFQCFLPPSGPFRGPPAFLPYAGVGGIPHLKSCQLR